MDQDRWSSHTHSNSDFNTKSTQLSKQTETVATQYNTRSGIQTQEQEIQRGSDGPILQTEKQHSTRGENAVKIEDNTLRIL